MKKQIARIRKRFNRFRERLRSRIAVRREATHDRIERLQRQHEAQQQAEAFRMFDSITLDAIPREARAVAGYVNGFWPTYTEVVRRWPNARHLSIAVTSSANAECLDVEPGDATPADAPAWVKRQLARGVKRPVVYTSLSQARTLLTTLANAGVGRNDVRLWTAHYTGTAHRCTSACGFGFTGLADATQFTDHSGGRNLDESLCAPDFL